MSSSPHMTMSSQTSCTESAQTRNWKKFPNTSETCHILPVSAWILKQRCFRLRGAKTNIFKDTLMSRRSKYKLSPCFIVRDLLKQFTTMELMRWASLVEDYGKELREGSPDSPATDVFSYTEEGEKRWKDLKNRVVEHVSAAVKCWMS